MRINVNNISIINNFAIALLNFDKLFGQMYIYFRMREYLQLTFLVNLESNNKHKM